jgi:hypothetical protein
MALLEESIKLLERCKKKTPQFPAELSKGLEFELAD